MWSIISVLIANELEEADNKLINDVWSFNQYDGK